MKYEYKSKRTDDTDPFRGSVMELNAMGQNRWELVAVILFHRETEWIFKRHLTTAAPDSEGDIDLEKEFCPTCGSTNMFGGVCPIRCL